MGKIATGMGDPQGFKKIRKKIKIFLTFSNGVYLLYTWAEREAQQKKEVRKMKPEQLIKKAKSGEVELMTDPRPGYHCQVRSTKTGKIKMVLVK